MRRLPQSSAVAATVDDYIAGFPSEVRARLKQVREVIQKAAPDAEESISYRIPAYKLQGVLVYFAGFKHHIGLYPLTAGVQAEFGEELEPFLDGKATARFPHERKLPLTLIRRMVKFRVRENAVAAEAKSAQRGARPRR